MYIKPAQQPTSVSRSPESARVTAYAAAARTRLLEEENLMFLRQVLGSQFGSINPRVDLLFEFIETASQGTW
jgi:hypothetical protein